MQFQGKNLYQSDIELLGKIVHVESELVLFSFS